MKAIIFLSFLMSSCYLFGQDTTDLVRLKNMSYMKYAENVNCNSSESSNLEVRICLNLEFQRVDSILNQRFKSLLITIENDSIKSELINFQKAWAENRRFQSQLISKGMRGHMLGIYYLDCMVKTTNRRIEELEYLLKID